jgi:hypothetical protein
MGQGYDQVLDIPGVSFEVFGISLIYPKSRKDVLKSEILEWDIPKPINDKYRVSFFVLGYLSLSHPSSYTVQHNLASRLKILPGSAH